MFDFRYHALSLVAVFLALLVGLLLGVAIGDRGLVSGAERDVKTSLRSDVRRAQSAAAGLRAQLAERRRVEEAAYPALVANVLAGRRVGVVELGAGSDRMVELTKAALAGSGATLASVSVLGQPLDLGAIAARSRGTPWAQIDHRPDLMHAFGRRVGDDLTRAGSYLNKIRSTILDSPSGSPGPLQGVVLVRMPVSLNPIQQAVSNDFEDGVVEGLKAHDVPVVGVQATSTTPSQIDWYRGHKLSSVDDVDDRLGRAALVFTLARQAGGTFGMGPGAETVLPPVLGTPSS